MNASAIVDGSRCAVLAILLSLALVTPVARAQSDGAPGVGFTALSDFAQAQSRPAVVPAERALPMIVWVEAGAAGGMARIEFQQDASQVAVIMAPIPANRVTLTPIVIPAAFSSRMTSVTVAVEMDDGSVGTTMFGQRFGVQGEPLTFDFARGDNPLVMMLGDSSLAPIGEAVARRSQNRGVSNADFVAWDPGLLTSEPRLLDVATAVLLGQTVRVVRPEVERAVAAWLEQGGHAIVLLDEVADWPSVAGLVAQKVVRDGAELVLTDAGRAHGWSIDPQRPWLATGPIGFGMATVLAEDPQRAGRGPNEMLTSWSAVLEPMALRTEAGADMASAKNPSQARRRPVRPAIGFSDAAVVSISALFTIDPPDRVVYVVLGLLLGLVLLLAVVDPLVLKRLRLRRMSWLTASLWIVLASGIAWLLPTLTRSEASQTGLVEVVDQLDGGPAYRTGLVAAFAATPLRYEYRVPGTGAGSDAGQSWWRGIAAPTSSLSGAELPLRLDGDRITPGGEVSSGSFTLRSALYTAPAPERIDAALSVDAGVLIASLDGVPSGMSVMRAWLETESGTRVGEVAGRSIRFERRGQIDDDVMSSTFLPVSADRRFSIRQRVQTGAWAAVWLVLERRGPIDAIRSTQEIEGIERRVVRAVVPLPAGAQEAESDSATENKREGEADASVEGGA